MGTRDNRFWGDDQAVELAPVSLWLWGVAAMVFVMVVVGGATRLTGSGLSITEWKPIMGAIPPLSEADWLAALAKYREIPQYKLLNKGMSLEAFKAIFWWEWGHRFLGRLIGLVFVLPYLYFLLRGVIRGRLAVALFGLFVLGGLQGALGWFMVQSGLVERTDVSQYRLMAHLTFASVLFAALVWTALSIGRKKRTQVRLATVARGSTVLALAIVVGVMLQIALGALVAGLKAGLTYNTWPLMDGRLVPKGLATLQPLWRNVFENVTTVQFDHRIVAYVLALLVLVQMVRVVRSADDAGSRRSAMALGGAVVGQLALGVWTLLAVVPISLGLLHQAGAMVVLGLAIWHLRSLVER
ncbi:MAG: COX15/CtaA family protein [Hyphomicrobiaceae bacterium]|nr:COX15/CtaA family protein [Hyphomicrobiaceae bacterium]